jgi:hypothetical protein
LVDALPVGRGARVAVAVGPAGVAVGARVSVAVAAGVAVAASVAVGTGVSVAVAISVAVGHLSGGKGVREGVSVTVQVAVGVGVVSLGVAVGVTAAVAACVGRGVSACRQPTASTSTHRTENPLRVAILIAVHNAIISASLPRQRARPTADPPQPLT